MAHQSEIVIQIKKIQGNIQQKSIHEKFPSFGGVDQFSEKIETGWFSTHNAE